MQFHQIRNHMQSQLHQCYFNWKVNSCASGHICRYVDHKGLAAMLTSIHSAENSAGVAPEVNLRIQKKIQKLPEVQNRDINGPHEKHLCPPKI